MNKKYLFIALGALALATAFTQCQKPEPFDEPMEVPDPRITIATFDDAIYELKWIARSLPNQLSKPMVLIPPSTWTSVRLTMESAIGNDPYWRDFISDLEVDLDNQIGYDLTVETENTLNTIDPGQDFTNGNLHGFTVNGNHYKTFISIPDYDIVDKNKTIVVVPATGEDFVWGYFQVTSTTIDSVMITDANMSDYYIWVVDIVADDIHGAPVVERKPTRCDDNGVCEAFEDQGCVDCLNRPCNKNGICEGWEDQIQCEDCNPTYKLRIKSFEFKKDKWGVQNKYLEPMLAGKYEMRVLFRHLAPDNFGVIYKKDTYADDEIFSLRDYKRKEVCRERGFITTRGCNSAPTVYGPNDFTLSGGILSLEFRKKDKFFIVFFEDDSKRLGALKRAIKVGYVHGANHSYTYGASTCYGWESFWRYGIPATVPYLQMIIKSQKWGVFENMDHPIYTSKYGYHSTSGNDGNDACLMQDVNVLLDYNDFTNNELVINNDYVRIVLELYQ